MIFLWLKIIYYKIRNRIDMIMHPAGTVTIEIEVRTGTDTTGPRARHEDGDPNHWSSWTDEPGGTVCPDKDSSIGDSFRVGLDPAAEDGLILYSRQAGKSTASTERLRELIEKGLVHEPLPDLNDMIRTDLLRADREARETRAMLTHDPRQCPCSGRHYPSAEACRWCRCHDPRNEHHVPCTRCGGADHPVMMHLPSDDLPSGWPRPIDPAEVEEHYRRTIEASYRPCSVCGAPDHAGVKHDEIKLMDTRPSKEIVCCLACGHPQHGEGSGRCAFSVASRMQDGGFTICPCAVTESEA